MLLIALAGKPNCGKSTFFKSLTLANVEIANYPFTTIDANKGVAYVRSKCPCKELGVSDTCTQCVDGVRFTPVELLDVAGLVPDAHLGRGLGNQFLDNLREADAIIQVVDASGSTDAEGNPVDVGTRNPKEDVEFLRYEFAMWMAGIIQKHLPRLVRQAQNREPVLIDLLGGALAGLRISPVEIREAVDECGINLAKATEEEIAELAAVLLRVSKPMIIAANKADQASEENLAALKEMGAVPTIAAGELALKSAASAKLLSYLPGDSSFAPVEGAKLSAPQVKALTMIAENMKKLGNTGVQETLNRVVFDELGMIIVYPVEDEGKYCNAKGVVLPDALLLPKGTTPRDLAFRIHTDIGNGFLYAVDAKSKMRIKDSAELKMGDVIKIVSTAK
ncbi:MAG TPA: redox-regulated ATPase YchF [Methanocorpusculum sp.]|jgi:ribosome-binding ATPase YchF (GTP1/OBG family)|nr:redox-regulated ATPase YchF [Methanocorpusculum sp.]MBR5007731.1 redox-regulated ATPase YchF [Methanocorpusculum sp.]MBR5450088.1 redox-regulated ATPase YchF [Methanocorpusculum sp.]HJJ61995.1 redox-regulated ATPase YchF [Methanocorpusculum sp.]HJJ65283.1 redox-regulated ATPase YchF [Methanocorpusculum sp.]